MTTVEKAMVLFESELANYRMTKKVNSGVLLHIDSLGQTGYSVLTLTAYDSSGRKSDKAMPFDKFIKTLNEIEDIAAPYQGNNFTGRVVGWNPTEAVHSFLFEKKIHRFFFLADEDVMKFVKRYTAPERVNARRQNGVDVLVIFG